MRTIGAIEPDARDCYSAGRGRWPEDQGFSLADPLNGKCSRLRDYFSYFLPSIPICLAVTESQREKLGKIVAKIGMTLYFLCLPIAMMRYFARFIFPFPGFFLGLEVEWAGRARVDVSRINRSRF